MENEVKPTPEVVPPTPEVKPDNSQEKTIEVDIYGEQVALPISKAKLIIAKRDTKTKEYKELQDKIVKAEGNAKAEAERAHLLELMKNQNAEAIEETVGAKYKETIQRFEKKVFTETIKSSLSKLGAIADGLEDAAKLVLADAKVELTGDDVTLNGIKADDYLKEWLSKKPHLASVKATPGKPQVGVKGATPKPPQPSSAEKLKSGLTSFLKPK